MFPQTPEEKLAAEKLAAEKLAAEKLAAEKLAAEKKVLEEKKQVEKLAAEKVVAKEKKDAEKLAAKKKKDALDAATTLAKLDEAIRTLSENIGGATLTPNQSYQFGHIVTLLNEIKNELGK